MQNRRRPLARFLLSLTALVSLALPVQPQTSAQSRPSTNGRDPGPSVYNLEDAYLNWPIAASDHAYAAIDGKRLHGYVKEVVEISRRYRDAGHPQYWGRIEGTEGDVESAQWVFNKLKQAGIPDVRIQSFDLSPQWTPKSWDVSAVGGGKTLKLATAYPALRSVGTKGTGLDVDAVYVGLGYAADFKGRDVRGKAVVIYSIPEPGVWANSANFNGSVQRAEDGGAAAVIVVICLPGNVRTAFPILRAPLSGAARTAASGQAAPAPTGIEPGRVPEFTMGYEDGESLRDLIETSGGSTHLKIRLDVEMIAGQKSANVWGVLPGTTDEKIMVVAHRDGYFDAAGDNASGMALLIGLAEYYAKVPKEKRRRTIEFVGSTGHHGDPIGVQWMAENKDTVLAKTALVMNAEHVALTEQIFFAGRMRPANTTHAEHWAFNGSRRLIDIGIKAFDTFGVATYDGTDPVSMAEISRISRLAPSFGVINVDTYYHSDHETPETVPWTGLGAVTRAFAKIIDDVNKVDIRDLQPVQTSSVQPTGRPAANVRVR